LDGKRLTVGYGKGMEMVYFHNREKGSLRRGRQD
jgi:hypothetical protein